MDEMLLVDAVERYLNGEMSEQERAIFDNLRKSNTEVDQMVVEHTLFQHQLTAFGERQEMKHQLHQLHNQLIEEGKISETVEATGGKLIQLWAKYRKVVAVAASMGGVVALVISGLVSYFGKTSNEQIEQLVNSKVIENNKKIEKNIEKIISSKSPNTPLINTGTGFLIDGKGYLLTNYHVISKTKSLTIVNNKQEEFRAKIIYTDPAKDLAILKIEDEDFMPFNSLPYGFKKSGADLGEQIYTLGYPRSEVVYGEGYMSAKTGLNGDTSNCQITISANPGNSGGPVLNQKGEIIGVLSSKEKNADGVVFAVQTKEVFKAINELKKDTTYNKIKISSNSSLNGMNRVQQVKKLEDCVFMIKGY
jgi:serine protease Do